MFSFSLVCQSFVVDVVETVVLAMFGLCENDTLIRSLDSCTPHWGFGINSLDLSTLMLRPLMCVISARCCQLPLFTVVVWGYFICIFFTGIMLTGVKARCLLWCDSHLGITFSRSITHDMVNPHNIWNPQLECCCQNSKQHLIIIIVICSFLCHFSFRPQGPLHETRWKCDWSIGKKKLLHYVTCH